MSRHSKQNTAVFSQKRADICSKMSRHIKQKAAESPFSRPQAAFFSPERPKKSTKAKRRKETPLPETTTKSNEKTQHRKTFSGKRHNRQTTGPHCDSSPCVFPCLPHIRPQTAHSHQAETAFCQNVNPSKRKKKNACTPVRRAVG